MYEGSEKVEFMRQQETNSAWADAEYWKGRCKELDDRLRLGAAHDLLRETASLEAARDQSEKRFVELREQIALTMIAADAADKANADATRKRDRALVAADRAQALVDEIRTALASSLADAYMSGQRSRRLIQIGGGLLLGVLTSFLASWLFELYRRWLL